ncbi:MAG: type I methionyl aminopeptidase [Candidatus Wallbacteria bacterium]|nr:type I methionyl aminopeptidase [Candidatus Wallbacteria bacterium]
MVELKSDREIENIRKAGEILAQVMDRLRSMILPGIKTRELDRTAQLMIKEQGGRPAFLGYCPGKHPFPASICASVNEEVVHGIPGERELREGDIISVDLGVEFQGYFADAAHTFKVGKVEKNISNFLKISENALYHGIDSFREGKRLFDISHAIQSYVEKHGYSVVRDFVGHGIGRKLHEKPEIPNYVPESCSAGGGIRLRRGMVFAIEPMVNLGTFEVEVRDNNWTVVTKDRMHSAHFEHTVALTGDGPVILTRLN